MTNSIYSEHTRRVSHVIYLTKHNYSIIFVCVLKLNSSFIYFVVYYITQCIIYMLHMLRTHDIDIVLEFQVEPIYYIYIYIYIIILYNNSLCII